MKNITKKPTLLVSTLALMSACAHFSKQGVLEQDAAGEKRLCKQDITEEQGIFREKKEEIEESEIGKLTNYISEFQRYLRKIQSACGLARIKFGDQWMPEQIGKIEDRIPMVRNFIIQTKNFFIDSKSDCKRTNEEERAYIKLQSDLCSFFNLILDYSKRSDKISNEDKEQYNELLLQLQSLDKVFIIEGGERIQLLSVTLEKLLVALEKFTEVAEAVVNHQGEECSGKKGKASRKRGR